MQNARLTKSVKLLRPHSSVGCTEDDDGDESGRSTGAMQAIRCRGLPDSTLKAPYVIPGETADGGIGAPADETGKLLHPIHLRRNLTRAR